MGRVYDCDIWQPAPCVYFGWMGVCGYCGRCHVMGIAPCRGGKAWRQEQRLASTCQWQVRSSFGCGFACADDQLVGPLTASSFPFEDIDILELYEHSKRVRPVIDLVSTMFHDMSVFNR